ncbi:hypothetical protein [Pedobacter sp. UYP1]|uniref:hypothetical protein n=1 Tax=Pedobacter sp. UYP1 TaxID=1756396 RepID=UPI003392ADBC
MTFLDIIRHPLTNLPVSYSGSFREMLKERISVFGRMIDGSTDLSGELNGRPFDSLTFKKRSKMLREGILKAIDIYYDGKPSDAYETLSNTLKQTNISEFLDKNHELQAGKNLYRIRTSSKNYALSRQELFHIPFQLRSKVSTQRYSIPGLPSLYVANSIYVAWEELKRPAMSEIHANRLTNKNPMLLLDLTSDIFSKNDHLIDNDSHGLDLLYKVTIWPLVAACSVKVKEPNDPFKPEYIIPQLLLQWVNKNKVMGIKYSSTHIDMSSSGHKGSFYNIVFPVHTFNLENGYCPVLSTWFQSTEVLPLQLRGFITQSDRLSHQSSISSFVNYDIQEICLIKGTLQPYSSTIFGILEHNLNGLEPENF